MYTALVAAKYITFPHLFTQIITFERQELITLNNKHIFGKIEDILIKYFESPHVVLKEWQILFYDCSEEISIFSKILLLSLFKLFFRI